MINKEKWEVIGKELSSIFANAKFKIGNDVITIQRRNKSESETVLAVFINGTISLGFSDEKHESFNPISHQVWKKKIVKAYSKQRLDKYKKELGARLFNKWYPKAERERFSVYWLPYFSSSKTLISQFKKIEGLEFAEDCNDKNDVCI